MEEIVAKADALYEKAYALSGTDPKKALDVASKLFSLSTKNNYPTGMALSRYIAGFSHYVLCDYTHASENFEQGASICSIHGLEKLSVKFYNGFGTVFLQLGSMHDAIREYSKGLELAKKFALIREEGQFLSNLGLISSNIGEFKEALAFLNEAEKLIGQINNDYYSMSVYNHLGEALKLDNQLDRAESVFRKSLDLSLKVGNRLNECTSVFHLSSILAARGQTEEALALVTRAQVMSRDSGFPELMVETLMVAGNIYFSCGRMKEAIEAFSQACDNIEKFKIKKHLGPALEARAKTKFAFGLFQEAFMDMASSAETSRAWFREDSGLRLAGLETAYRLDKIKSAAALERNQREHMEAVNDLLHIVSRIGKSLAATMEPKAIILRMWEALNPSISMSSLALGIYVEESGLIDFPGFIEKGIFYEGKSVYIDDEASIAALCVKKKATLYFRNRKEALAARGISSFNSVGSTEALHTMLFIPLFKGDTVTGVITMQSPQEDAYSRDIVEMLEAIASFAAIAVENTLIKNKLEMINTVILGEKEKIEKLAVRSSWLAEHDSLTKLPNRLFLNTVLGESLSLATMNGTKTALFYMDLDGFKPINDNYGHDAGDKVLVQVAERLRNLFRSSDYVVRVGGDEFIALASGITDFGTITLIAEKIAAGFKKPIELVEGSMKVGVSIGIAVFPVDTKDSARIVKYADEALYEAKKREKGSYLFWSDLQGGKSGFDASRKGHA